MARRMTKLSSFLEQGSFQLLNYRLVQKGPVFKVPLDMTIDRSTGKVLVRYTDEKGKGKEESDRLELPPDLANGMIPVLLKNISRDAEADDRFASSRYTKTTAGDASDISRRRGEVPGRRSEPRSDAVPHQGRDWWHPRLSCATGGQAAAGLSRMGSRR